METNTSKQTIEIEINKQKINVSTELLLTPNNNDLVLAHKAVIKRLAENLSKVSTKDIIGSFITKLERRRFSMSLEDFITTLEDEINFHNTVNLMKSVKLPNEKKESEVIKSPMA